MTREAPRSSVERRKRAMWRLERAARGELVRLPVLARRPTDLGVGVEGATPARCPEADLVRAEAVRGAQLERRQVHSQPVHLVGRAADELRHRKADQRRVWGPVVTAVAFGYS